LPFLPHGLDFNQLLGLIFDEQVVEKRSEEAEMQGANERGSEA
jgi:hypothetical protein